MTNVSCCIDTFWLGNNICYMDGTADWQNTAKTQDILPYSDKRKQVTNHPNLRKWCFSNGLSIYSTSILRLEEKHSPCWKIFKSRHHDIALISMYMADTFCSFTRNFIFESCFLLSEYGSIVFIYCAHHWWGHFPCLDGSASLFVPNHVFTAYILPLIYQV